MAREPRTIRALRARARSWPCAAAGARRGRDDPWHHHTPVLEHDRKAARCAPAERKHLGRLGPTAAREQGGGDSGRFEHTARCGAGRRRCLSLLVSRFEVFLVVHGLQPLVEGLLARNLQREMGEPAVGRGSVSMLHPRGDVDHIARAQLLCRLSPFLVKPSTSHSMPGARSMRIRSCYNPTTRDENTVPVG